MPIVTTKTEYYLLVSREDLLRLRCQLSPRDPIMPQINDALKIAYPQGYPTMGWPHPEN